jgi:GntR family transcriptional regulator
MYPLKLIAPIKDYLWGGTRLKTDFGFETDKDIAAEGWMLSCHKDGSGVVVNGDEVPSRRVLSALLGVNPNTIQKAYRILEEEKLMESHSGAKSYMVLNDKSISLVRKQLLDNDATSIVNSLKQMGLSKEEAVALIENYWE